MFNFYQLVRFRKRAACLKWMGKCDSLITISSNFNFLRKNLLELRPKVFLQRFKNLVESTLRWVEMVIEANYGPIEN